MILCDYINEKAFVQKFINETMNQKISLNGKEHHWLVWGAEIWLPEGGRDGFSGSLDLIATDDTGKVWLVEAKLRTNPELCPAIWKKQILPYRYGLAKLLELICLLFMDPLCVFTLAGLTLTLGYQ